MALDHLGGPCT